MNCEIAKLREVTARGTILFMPWKPDECTFNSQSILSLSIILNHRVENKNFYFDIGQNNRGVYMRIRFINYTFLQICDTFVKEL